MPLNYRFNCMLLKRW